MSVDATMHFARTGRTDGILDWLQMLTGAGLILFMWSHMILVSSVIIGPGVMNAIAHFFEATYMAQVGGPIIFMIFLFHFFLAARKVPFRIEQQRVISAHARMMRHRDTWLWVVQVVTAMIILIMGSIHMWVVLTDLPITAHKSAARVQTGWWLAFYMLLLPLVELHVSIGFYRIGVKWGFLRRDNRAKGKKIEYGLLAIFITIGLLTLIRLATLSTVAAG
jgi:fumarate reductase subunit C